MGDGDIMLWTLHFKSRLDKFWTNQDVLYNWEADFTGTAVYWSSQLFF